MSEVIKQYAKNHSPSILAVAIAIGSCGFVLAEKNADIKALQEDNARHTKKLDRIAENYAEITERLARIEGHLIGR